MSEDQFGAFSTHAQVPTAILLGDRIRVYFAARDQRNQSYPTFADFTVEETPRLIEISSQAVLPRGKPGTFDEDGLMPSHVLRLGDRLRMYYTGWNRKVSTPYHNSIGVAESVDGGLTFERLYDGPVMDRIPQEPYIAVTPSILYDGKVFRCWYNSGVSWEPVDGKLEAVYVIKYAEAEDGINWARDAEVCISPLSKTETCSNPTVFQRHGMYHMLFCSRGIRDYRGGENSYRFGYASSSNGRQWTRMDSDLKLIGSAEAWESKMTCYPFHISAGGRDLIFYNGNAFGQTGFGVLEVVD